MSFKSHALSSYLLLNKPSVARPDVICECWQFQQRLTSIWELFLARRSVKPWCQQKFSHHAQERSCKRKEWVSFEELWKHSYDKCDAFARLFFSRESCTGYFDLVVVTNLFFILYMYKKNQTHWLKAIKLKSVLPLLAWQAEEKWTDKVHQKTFTKLASLLLSLTYTQSKKSR